MSTEGFMIVGCPRSGTTLLQQKIMTNYRVFTTVETHYFSLLNPISRISKLLSPRLYLKERARKRLFNCTSVKLRDIKNDFTYFEKVMEIASANHGCQAWCEKTPRHLHFIAEIERNCPNIKFIHILRNGYDVVRSLDKAISESKNKWVGVFRKSPTRNELIDRWNKDLQISKQYFGKENHYFIVYEDFIHDPNRYLERIFSGVEVNNNNNTFEIIESSEIWKKNNKKSYVDITKGEIEQEFYSTQFNYESYEELRIAIDNNK